MPAWYQIRYEPAGRVESFAGSRGNYYELADGTHIDVDSEPVWCRTCGRVTHGERLASVEEIDGRIANLERLAAEILRELHRPPLPTPDAPGDQHQREQIAELRLRRAWRERRVSPPKCIDCGSTDIVMLPYGQPVPHPAGPGTIEARIVGMCSTDFNEWFFTPEGDRIPRDTKPTYWHHPDPEVRSGLRRMLDRFMKRQHDRDQRGAGPAEDEG